MDSVYVVYVWYRIGAGCINSVWATEKAANTRRDSINFQLGKNPEDRPAEVKKFNVGDHDE